VKTCEYCGSEVPDETAVCPNCAAHFDPSTMPLPYPWMPEPPEGSADPNPFKSRWDRSFWSIGRVVAFLFVIYLVLMVLGLLGSINRWLLLAGILLVAAALILRKALKS
jgi:hypothetical protein